MAPVRRSRTFYRFKRGETVPTGLKRIVREQFDSAIGQLSGQGKNRTEAVHEARKSLKKIRAVLRLTRKELGSVYGAETTQLRRCSGKLSEIRDAAAQIETIDSLRKKAAREPGAAAFSPIRRALVARRKKFEEAAEAGGVFPGVASALRTVARRVKGWPLQTDGFAALAPGIKRAFRRGRTAFLCAREDPSPENLHLWRRRVKDLWYQMRLIEPVWTDALEKYTGDLKDLQDWLGEHQNLVMLRASLAAQPEIYGRIPEIDMFLRMADAHQARLRRQALSLGETVYRKSPRRFLRDVEQSWLEHGWTTGHPPDIL